MFARNLGRVGSSLLSTVQKTSNQRFSSITRMGVDDPRMSKIVVHNGTVYLSGLVDATLPDVEGQTKVVLAQVDDLLAEAGTSKSNLLTASIWLKDIDRDFKAFNSIWCDWLDPENKPVRATVQSPMATPSILVEVQVTAATAD
eukprot:CAMPEP_0195252476 /NCGR_PEP_ID=MMETSP0706-20130129/3883_1 /TAXON_ID=33640 /ORGANISM="Asterionellopsis glacialis, Strain CCMP134" /LENGTH=143 /DNA_ID=CAMNT_0040304775 /DNA_START=92 /DNA_END=523 /DNA_ORIENTATION=+